jgi:hypothetical protein
VASNSHKEYVDLVMTASLGQNWEQFFNIVICYSRKPNFFRKSQPFFEVIKDGLYKGNRLTNVAEFERNNKYNFRFTEGSSKTLTEYLQKTLKKDNVRTCYFGDNYQQDVAEVHLFNDRL